MNRRRILLLSLVQLSLIVSGVVSQQCPDGSDYLVEHPFKGRCECDRQIWVSEMCKEGYWCIGTTGEGCYKVRARVQLCIRFQVDFCMNFLSFSFSDIFLPATQAVTIPKRICPSALLAKQKDCKSPILISISMIILCMFVYGFCG